MSANSWQPPFPPGTLRERILEAHARGHACGALLPIPTTFVEVEDVGVPFVVRMVDNLRRKAAARRAQEALGAAPADPFLPCDPELYVADVSDTHVAVLNKFNVIDHHLLIVTRDFEHQEELLTVADFHALWRCLREVEGLAFYNGGVVAGASQEHKHLQIAPYPITEGREAVPVDAVVRASLRPGISRVEVFPFEHAIASCEAGWSGDPHVAACGCHARYVAMLAATGLLVRPGRTRQPAPYNLLVTREWMMVVPRTKEFFEGMSINAIGYAGGLLVRSESELGLVREAGPMRVIASCAPPR